MPHFVVAYSLTFETATSLPQARSVTLQAVDLSKAQELAVDYVKSVARKEHRKGRVLAVVES